MYINYKEGDREWRQTEGDGRRVGGSEVQLFDITIYLFIALKLGGVMCLISSAKLFRPFTHLNCKKITNYKICIANLKKMGLKKKKNHQEDASML
jgi:hypothetical protein